MRHAWIFLFISTGVWAQSSSDSAKERQFYQIYRTAMEQPTSTEAWSKAGTGKAQSYEIQKGDTLWQISQTLFGDPNFYPKVWSLNPDIFNPHQINPQHVIQFTEGSPDEPPTLSMGTAPDANSAPNATVVEEKQATDSVLPQPIVEDRPLMLLPDSLPAWLKATPSKVIFEVSNSQRAPAHAQVILETFIHEGGIQPLGSVTEIESGGNTSGEEHLVYLKFLEKPSQTHYLLVDDSESLHGLKSGFSARKLTVLAEVDLIAPANSAENLYIAKTSKIINAIDVGALITTGAMETVSAEETTTSGNVAARIIGGAKDEERKVFGEHEIVFLSEGSNKGLAPGQMLNIYRRQPIRVPQTEHIENYRPIGRVKILKVTGEFSTGIVTKSIDAIYIGDSTINAESSEFIVKEE